MVPVRVAALFPPTPVQVDLYLGSGATLTPRLYSKADVPPTPRDLQALREAGTTVLYTPSSQADVLYGRFHDMIDSKIDMPTEVYFEVAREVARDSLGKAWTSATSDALVVEATTFVDTIFDAVDPGVPTHDLIRMLLKHDGDTFTHVTNVCVYLVMLLRQLGMTDEARLTALGQAALLHDVGKRHIVTDLLRLPRVLTPDEKAQLAQHPSLGFQELCDQPNFDRDQLLMIYHHHEKVDGTGYPVRLVGEEIHWTGRACAVVDVFDALTARRPYREPMTAEEATAYLQHGVGKHFDKEFVQCWASLVCNTLN